MSCDAPGEARADAGLDCDDADATVNPAAAERVGDERDGDCDGIEVCRVDTDGDGYVDASDAVVDSLDADCADAGEARATAPAGDCDDADAAYNPGAPEPDCTDPRDYNCDGSVGYADADGDGFAACAECDDGSAAVNPAATELPGDGVDSDCDGVERCYVDTDGDGYRPDATSTVASANVTCDGPGEALASAAADDCDDTDATVSPAATELVGDERDSDCDGVELCRADADGDGYTPDGDTSVSSADARCDGAGEALATAPAGDCDDADAGFNPGALEEDCADPNDYNCDGSVGYVDADGDGFAACAECDDGAAGVHPDADERCDGVDNDCDGTVDVDAIDAPTWYVDADGDGYTGADTVTDCAQPEGYAAAPSEDADCDDSSSVVFPGGDELPGDGIDQDCDGADGEIGRVVEDPEPPGDLLCGCATTGPAGPLWALGSLAALLAVRRRAGGPRTRGPGGASGAVAA